jgi:hypothetical protein
VDNALTGPIQKTMNHKRGFPAFLAAFVLVFLFGYVWHGMLMKGAYQETSSLWRSAPDFQSHFWILILGHAVVAFAFTGHYVSKVGMNSPAMGLGYGVVIGILCGGVELIRFAVEPLTFTILWMWLIGDVLQFAIVGAAVGAIYKPLTTAA